MYMYMYVYVCLSAMHVSHVYMYVWVCVCMYVCICASRYVCVCMWYVCVCMYVCHIEILSPSSCASPPLISPLKLFSFTHREERQRELLLSTSLLLHNPSLSLWGKDLFLFLSLSLRHTRRSFLPPYSVSLYFLIYSPSALFSTQFPRFPLF